MAREKSKPGACGTWKQQVILEKRFHGVRAARARLLWPGAGGAAVGGEWRPQGQQLLPEVQLGGKRDRRKSNQRILEVKEGFIISSWSK